MGATNYDPFDLSDELEEDLSIAETLYTEVNEQKRELENHRKNAKAKKQKRIRRVTLSLEKKYVDALEKAKANTKRAGFTSILEDLLDDSGFMKKWG